MLNIDSGASVILAGQVLLAFDKLSTDGVAAGVTDLHLGAVVRRVEGVLITSLINFFTQTK